MRIAIVDAFFPIGLGYSPTSWFNAFASLGHRVRAFCTPYIYTAARHLYDKPFPEGLETIEGGDVLRLPARLLPRDIVACTGLLPKVQEFKPDITLAIYPQTMFARELFINRRELPGVLVSTFNDNRAQRRTATPNLRFKIKRALLDAGFFVLKRRFYRRMIEASDAVLFQTPDTFDTVLPRIPGKRRRAQLRRKCALSPLGFDPTAFNVDDAARRAERDRLGVRDDEVLAFYSCKITPVKRLDLWVSIMASVMRRVPRMKAMLVGAREGEAECARILQCIKDSGMADRFVCQPFADRQQLPRLCNAADFGFWYLQPSIGIQEAMGAGMYMILPDDRLVSHLAVEPITGRYFPEGDFQAGESLIVETAKAFLDGELGSVAARVRRAEVNASRFSYKTLAEQVVAAAQDLPNALAHLDLKYDRPPPGGERLS